MGFKKVVKEIKRLNALDKASISKRMCKITEEVGELAQAVNKTNGRKKIGREENKESIMKGILSEGADSIQTIISLLIQAGFTAKQIIDSMTENNEHWEQSIKDKGKI